MAGQRNDDRHTGARRLDDHRRCAIITAAFLLSPTPGWSQQPASPSQPVAQPAPPPAAVVTPQSHIDVRVYEGFTTPGPAIESRDDTPLAVDVRASMATCPDGNTEIRALNIGGWNYQAGSSCSDAAQRGTIRVDAGSAQAGPAAGSTASPQTDMRCDPATWRCTPVP